MPLAAFTGTLGRKAAAHLLRRATFGPTKSDIDTFAAYTPATALNVLFQSTPEPPEPVLPGTSATWLTTPPPPMGEDDGDQQQYLKQWWLGVMLNTKVAAADRLPFSTRERITYFLHTHFTTIQETVGSSRALYYQNVMFRRFALDGSAPANVNIKQLAKKICIDNAMLVLLDGRLNVKSNPNENFAREVLELYTIGKGLSGQIPDTGTPGDYYYYTEHDVQTAAKVLSGYDFDDTFGTPDADTNLPRAIVKLSGLVANQHENSVKTFSARLGTAVVTPTVPTNPTEASVLDELDQLIDILFNQAETARHICRKIYRFYVYHDITAAIDSTIISDMVTTLTSGGFKIEPVIKELLASQHFYDSIDASVDNDNFGALIKSPLDLVCGTLNFFEFAMPDYTTNAASFYMKAEALVSKLYDQGMNFMNPYDVAGYEAYHQYPLYNRHWINTNALTQRYNFIFLTMETDDMAASSVQIDLLAYMKLRFAANATDPDAFVREIVSYIFPLSTETTEITTARLDWFKARLLKLGSAEADPLAFWVTRWNTAYSIPGNDVDTRGMLQDMVNAMMQSPEYQLF
jgi:uncharacterized protein (DUF1800 family)